MMHFSQIRVSQSSNSNSQSGRVSGIKHPRLSYLDRQNDPAYHREVQYTWSESSKIKYTRDQVHEIVRLLCKDQGRNVPLMHDVPFPDTVLYTLKELNQYVEMHMENSTPINRLIPVSR